LEGAYVKGWFKVPGQDGDRSVKDQLRGLEPALKVAKGKTVLDLGAAECAISREFALAGATVVAIEREAQFCDVGRKLCEGLYVEVIQANLDVWIDEHPEQPQKFDIVLALSVAHKLFQPGKLLSFACRSAQEMVVFRGPGKQNLYWDGILKAKFAFSKEIHGQCHVPSLMAEHGFFEGDTLPSGQGERVQYWHRK
jgi:protein-L-isoaspartate O-methyltransferase